MVDSDLHTNKSLSELKQELRALNDEIDILMVDNTVTNLKLGHLLKRHRELKRMIKKMEDDLIPDMPA